MKIKEEEEKVANDSDDDSVNSSPTSLRQKLSKDQSKG